jgi:signal transduction histidine kinase
MPAQRQIEILLAENRTLKGTVAVLKMRLLAEKNDVADERSQLSLLREANQHLVLATFGAQDSTSTAEAAIRRQTVFLSMLAHELRNPLASIVVASNVMKGMTGALPQIDKMVGIVGRQVAHLMRMVDDLLDASRIATGKISLQTSLVSLADVIDSALETAQPLLSRRMQNVELVLPPAPLLLLGDMVRLSQLFANLLINASKFSPPNTRIDITAGVRDGMLAVAVKDQGVGIDLQYQSHIFDLFAQGPREREHAPDGGLGIGLSLAKTIAEMHGGSVHLVSDGIDRGSEFTVLLPLPAAAAGAPG